MNGTDVDPQALLTVAFPLPFQIFALIGVAILAWATNLHLLDLSGIDLISLLDLRTNVPNALPAHSRVSRLTLVALYRAVYRIFVAYSLWCFVAWSAYRYRTHGDVRLVDLFGYIPCILALSILFVVFCPFNILHKTERRKFLYAIRRCLNPSSADPIYFSDVILADIITSFAQVIGDVWLSLCMLLPGHSMLHPTAGTGMARWILPTVMSLPYLIRLRQCVIEYENIDKASKRPLYNALKYATAFPVVFLSAAQPRTLDPTDSKAIDSAWHGESPIFRLWLLAALVNSLYSFWWDVTNDWGFDLLKLPFEDERSRSSPTHPSFSRFESETPYASARSSFDEKHISLSELSSSVKKNEHRQQRQHRYGLRSQLHYPVLVYPVLIALNLVLRLTWSLRLFSVVNVKAHAELANFGLKLAELFRRWMWVFVRVEWEMVKKGQDSPVRVRDQEEYELISPGLTHRT